MMGADDGVLAGRVILLTRPRSRGGDLADRLRALGALVIAQPTIQFEAPADPEPARRAVAEIALYDWVAFTSPAGVSYFTALYRQIHGEAHVIRARLAAIGSGTARALGDAGLTADLVGLEAHSEGLAAVLVQHVCPAERILVVRPEVSRPLVVDALTGMGALVEAPAFYRTTRAPGTTALIRDVRAGRFNVWVLTSPSTLERLLEASGPTRAALVLALSAVRLVAIGETTATAVRSAGLHPSAVATEPTVEGIVGAVVSLDR